MSLSNQRIIESVVQNALCSSNPWGGELTKEKFSWLMRQNLWSLESAILYLHGCGGSGIMTIDANLVRSIPAFQNAYDHAIRDYLLNNIKLYAEEGDSTVHYFVAPEEFIAWARKLHDFDIPEAWEKHCPRTKKHDGRHASVKRIEAEMRQVKEENDKRFPRDLLIEEVKKRLEPKGFIVGRENARAAWKKLEPKVGRPKDNKNVAK